MKREIDERGCGSLQKLLEISSFHFTSLFYTTELILIIQFMDTTLKTTCSLLHSSSSACYVSQFIIKAMYHFIKISQQGTFNFLHIFVCLLFSWAFRNSQVKRALTQVKARCLVCVRNAKVYKSLKDFQHEGRIAVSPWTARAGEDENDYKISVAHLDTHICP